MSADKLLERSRTMRPAGPERQGHRWIEELGEEGRERLASHTRALSIYIRGEAVRLGFDYFEMGAAFQEGVLRAVDALAA